MPRDTFAILMTIIYCQCLNRCDIPGVYIQPLGMWKVDYLSVDFIEEKVMRQFSFFSFFLFPFFPYYFFFFFFLKWLFLSNASARLKRAKAKRSLVNVRPSYPLLFSLSFWFLPLCSFYFIAKFFSPFCILTFFHIFFLLFVCLFSFSFARFCMFGYILVL